MQCPRCHVASRDGLKFCEDCGARLAAVCSQCGEEITPRKKFCGQPSAWALIRGGLNRWLAQADGLAEQLFNIAYARLEHERVKAVEKEETLLAHLAELKRDEASPPRLTS